MNWTRVVLIFWTLVGTIITAVTLPWYLISKNEIVYGFLMVGIVLVYEFWMRILLGIVLIKPTYNVDAKRFKVHNWELKIYNFFRMKKWIKHAPTFNPDQYDATKLSLDEIIQNTCRNEVTHSVYFFLTYVPILWAFWLGYMPFCVIQAVIVCQTDVILISLQRFNRNRLLKLNRRTRKNP